MSDAIMNFEIPQSTKSDIKVIGVGGGGGNAVNFMFRQGIKDVEFMVCNTDAQALSNSPVAIKVQLGASLTEGRGAGNKPEMGCEAAKENIEDVKKILQGTKMVFITAGMGGGTGTGAAPVIAEAARELGILTVGIVTIPFRNEGRRRVNQAVEGIERLQQHVDSLLVINNEKIREMYGDFKISEAFSKADNVLTTAAKGIAEIITVHGYINVDFADVETVMRNSGVSIMGAATCEGEDRAIRAVEEALTSPLLNNNDIRGAKNILLNITSGVDEITMDEIGEITDYVQAKAGHNADLIWGNGIDENLNDEVCVTIIATGFNSSSIPELMAKKKKEKTYITLGENENTGGSSVWDRMKSEPKPKKVAKETSQTSLEFERSKPVTEEYEDIYGPSKTAGEPEPMHSDKSLKLDFYETDEESIDELENIPAYKRRGMNLKKEDYQKGKTVSRFSLSEDKDRNPQLRKDNPFLHDNVD
ncbi:cell division protein FtsZ [Prolixibacteraceae bacterium JC049]|nr:cell division protein FtsZ [Prolixibacteraceae bacterium JC049]